MREEECESRSTSLNYFFEPKSLAIVGASERAMKPGNILINNLVRFDYQGKIFPVNPRGVPILGLKTYTGISEIPGDIDLVFSLLGIEGNLTLIEECSKKGVRGLVVAAGGYSDAGNRGRDNEKELVTLAHKHKIRVIGPNTVGYTNPHHDVILSMIDTKQPLLGRASFICQTGQFATNIIEWMMSFCKTGISQCIDLGNKADIDDSDIIEHLNEDSNTAAIGIYTETFKNARHFMDSAARVSIKKPIVVFKPGRTEEGAKMASSHTGALATDEKIINSAIRQAGIIRAHRVDEFLDMMRLLSRDIRIKGNRIGIVTNTGAGAIMSIDTMEKYGLKPAELTDKTKEALIPAYASYQKPGNPVDIGPAIGVKGPEKSFEIALRALDADPNVDCILLISIAFHSKCLFVPDFGHIGAICKRLSKPVIAGITGSEIAYFMVHELLEPAGVVTYPGPEAATTGIGAGYQYTLGMDQIKAHPSFKNWRKQGSNKAITSLLEAVQNKKRKILTEKESKDLLSEAGIPVNDCHEIGSPEEAVQRAEEIGLPVVLKLSSSQVVHKSDIGGVKLNLSTPKEIVSAYQEIVKAGEAYDKDCRVTVQRMVEPGLELIIGVTTDTLFGPVIAFGLGGILAEVLKDISTRIIPIKDRDADAMIREIRGYPVLEGYRGMPAINLRNLKELLLKVSDLVTHYPVIKEIDLNPVVARGDSVTAVDARILF